MLKKNKISSVLSVLRVLNDLGSEGIKITRTFSLLIMVLTSIIFFASPNRIFAVEEEIMTLIETAKTPQDHIKIAEFYEMQAAKAAQKANKHAAMASAYKDRSKPMPGMVTHCNDLVKDYKAEAAEYSKMAAEHRKMAQELKAQ
jgi:hypothetical protein